MKTMHLALMGFLALASGAESTAASGTFILRDGRACLVENGRKLPLKHADVLSSKTDKGVWSWARILPGEGPAAKGMQNGFVLFRGGEETQAGFLPLSSRGYCQLDFSRSGDKLVSFCEPDGGRNLALYAAGETAEPFVRKTAFPSAGIASWVDRHRFVFTLVDEAKGLRTADRNSWHCSLALYDAAEGRLTILRQATATRDFIYQGYNEEEDLILVLERSVQAPEDWNSGAKITEKDISVPVPAAG